MFYSRVRSHLGFSLEINKGNSDDDNPTVARVTVTLRLPPSCSTHGETTINSEAKIQIGGKQGEQRKPDQFRHRNEDDERRHALISLLFSPLLLSLPSLFFGSRHKGVTTRGGVTA